MSKCAFRNPKQSSGGAPGDALPTRGVAGWRSSGSAVPTHSRCLRAWATCSSVHVCLIFFCQVVSLAAHISTFPPHLTCFEAFLPFSGSFSQHFFFSSFHLIRERATGREVYIHHENFSSPSVLLCARQPW